MLFSFKTALMQSSRDFCRQSILCSLIRGSDAGISTSKFTYSVAESSGQHSWKSASNYKSSPSISIKSSFLIIPHFSKQSFIIIPVTSFHASWAHRMAISMFTSLIIYAAEEYSLICENESIIDFGWHVALSRIKTTFLCSSNSFLLKRVSTACITSDVIHDFELKK